MAKTHKIRGKTKEGVDAPIEGGAIKGGGSEGGAIKSQHRAGRHRARFWQSAVACLAAALLVLAGCASDGPTDPSVPTAAPLPTAPPDDLETPPPPPPIGDLLPGFEDVVPTLPPLPTEGPAPTEAPVPTAAPVPTFEDAAGSAAGTSTIERLTPSVVSVYRHDPEAFTQGLLFEDGRMYESTGLYEASTLREVDYRSGQVLRQIVLADTEVGRDMRFFAEGLALVDDRQGGSRLVQLTWEHQMAFAWDTETFHETAEPLEQYRYKGEGWGLCYDGDRLAMSNGTSVLNFHSPEGFAMVGESLTVTLDGNPVELLNELECVGDEIWANVWLTDLIMRIDARTGEVTGVVDASPLTASLGAGCGTSEDTQGSDAAPAPDAAPNPPASAVVAAIQEANLPLPCVTDPNAVLNGIAHDETTGRFFLTGKNWPILFEVRF